MAKSKPAVGVKRDLPQLCRGVGLSGDAERAVAEGLLSSEKIQGNWVYGSEPDLVRIALDRMGDALELTLTDWLLGRLVMAAGNARQRVKDIEISSGAAQQLTKELLWSDRVRGVGLLTQAYQPHVAVYGARDYEEVQRQIQVGTGFLDSRGAVDLGDLPDPLHERQLSTWRGVVLEHLEFLGAGWLDGSTLRSYEVS